MKDKTVAILESRMRDHIASLVRKYGGTPFSAPALAEIPDVDLAHIDELIRDWNSAPSDIFIFQTGVGTRALFAATDLLGLTDVLLRLLDSAQVVVRGPKPATVLHSHKVRIDFAASDPFTTHEVLAAMHGTPLRGKRVVVQRYGETNRELQAALESEGADVTEIVTYRWGLPEDTAPLLRLIGALGRDEIDLVAFTSASQASNLFAVAQYDGKEASLKQSLDRTLVASIGPVCSATAADPRVLTARYRPNQQYTTKTAPSSLVLSLQQSAWIPQRDESFVRPADASRDLLPDGFAFDPGWPWLKAMGFGQEVAKKSEEHRQKQAIAKEFGFADNESLERAKRFAALPQEEQERILADREQRPAAELPNKEPGNPERRAERVIAQAVTAPERVTEIRNRSVSVGREEVKEDAAQYLRQQYTNADGEMICQVCKAPLPFKLDDGSYYFEKVEFLTDLQKRHYQNYLALCPNHAAMFQHANGSAEMIREMFSEIAGNELEVVLAQQDATVYFTKTHIADLRSVLEAERTSSAGDCTDGSQS